MHAAVRSYPGRGASELFEQFEQRNEEIKHLIGGLLQLLEVPPGTTRSAGPVCGDVP
jgi:hypothetical protein